MGSNSDKQYSKSSSNQQGHEVPYQPLTPSTDGITGHWSTGLCDCFDDPSNCTTTCCCPCITFGQIAEIVDRGTISSMKACLLYLALGPVGCGWMYASMYRSKLRGIYSLEEKPCADFLVHCCCCVCSLTQEYWELNKRGANPSIGWQANVERWSGDESIVPPAIASGMAR